MLPAGGPEEGGAAGPEPGPGPEGGGCSKEELVRRLRREEAARLAALVQRGRLMRGVNRQLQEHLREVRELRAANGRLAAENRELRDLCLFLDEDRLRSRRLARHWQLFGREAARALREEVGGCLRKLAGLEGLQERLARDNLELKELCLALDRQCAAHGPPEPGRDPPVAAAIAAAGPGAELPLPCGPRDLGDGSSSTGSLGSPDQPHAACSPDG